MFRGVLPYETFSDHVVRANSGIEVRIRSLPNIQFWYHRGFGIPQSQFSIIPAAIRVPMLMMRVIGNISDQSVGWLVVLGLTAL